MTAPARTVSERVRTRGLAIFTLLLTILVMCGETFLAVRPFDEAVRGDLQSRASTVAQALSDDIGRLVEQGVPLKGLHGLEEGSGHFLKRFPELRYIVVVDPDGNRVMSLNPAGRKLDEILAQRGPDAARGLAEDLVESGAYLDLRRPIVAQGRAVAQIHVGVSADFALTQAKELYADILVIFFIAALLITEILLVVFALNVNRPLQRLQDALQAGASGIFVRSVTARAGTEIGRVLAGVESVSNALVDRFQQLAATGQGGAVERQGLRFVDGEDVKAVEPNAIRLPLVFFLFGTELSRSFFPLYVRDLYEPVPWLSEEVAIALPMSLWVAALMMVTPIGSKLIDRFGIRGAIAAGMAPSAIGLAITAVAQDFMQLCLGRIVTAAGFGVVTVSAIIFISRGASGGRSTRDMSVFVGASATASICGVSVGGILSDHFGPRVTFMIAVAFVVTALCLLFMQVPALEGERGQAKKKVTLADYLKILARPRVTGFVLLAAMPVRLILTGFLFYTTPLRLAAADFSEASIGRVMMAYFIMMSLATPLVAWASDRWKSHRLMLISAGLTSGAGACLFGVATNTSTLVAAVALVGLGQALASAPLLALTTIQFPEENARFGNAAMVAFFRIVERIGSIAGPLVAAALAAAVGFGSSSLWFGAIMVLFSACLALFFAFGASRKEGTT